MLLWLGFHKSAAARIGMASEAVFGERIGIAESC
jgi:hypothetical protein